MKPAIERINTMANKKVEPLNTFTICWLKNEDCGLPSQFNPLFENWCKVICKWGKKQKKLTNNKAKNFHFCFLSAINQNPTKAVHTVSAAK